ncbi:acyl carrier protein [Methylocucumis oryzae]|uniref:acyl carrier protein n=1 Tax=Methylocucumis oryzae TaxID=1632867 RepID=UPI000697CFA5|nr:acyl carrier protein [Methylocucumis oryzae]
MSINWPYWENGGMQMDASLLNKLREQTGMLPLSNRLGMVALYNIMAAGVSQALVWSSEPKPSTKQPKPVTKPDKPESNNELTTRTEAYFQQFVADVLDLPVHEVHLSEDLSSYGINSILVLSATSELEKHFGVLAKTLFFQYRTVRELSAYFMREHQPALLKLLAINLAPVSQAALRSPGPALATAFKPMPREQAQPQTALDIAIIGVSGRYPMADDLEAFLAKLTLRP